MPTFCRAPLAISPKQGQSCTSWCHKQFPRRRPRKATSSSRPIYLHNVTVRKRTTDHGSFVETNVFRGQNISWGWGMPQTELRWPLAPCTSACFHDARARSHAGLVWFGMAWPRTWLSRLIGLAPWQLSRTPRTPFLFFPTTHAVDKSNKLCTGAV